MDYNGKRGDDGSSGWKSLAELEVRLATRFIEDE